MSQSFTTLAGVVERITYTNPENGYTVARIKADRQFGLITVVGPLADVHPGARLKMEGRWKTHPKYGEQFELVSYTEESPATVEGIKRYLGSGLIKGIGPVMAAGLRKNLAPTPWISLKRILTG
jgi:exodeoxyribonuclease V alpha subunit